MIECTGLGKRYGDAAVVDAVSFQLPAGSLCAFLGPNGAGKSTTLKMLTGLVPPGAGQARVDGIDVAAEPLALQRRIGVLPEHLGLFDHLTVAEHLELAGPVYGLPEEETRRRSADLLRALVLDHGRDTFADHCSHGMRKKTALAMALLHNPRVLFLDEPFEGIDPVTAKVIADLLVDLTGRGITVFFTSHILSIVERIATHYILIRGGRIVWNSTAAELPDGIERLYFELVEPARHEEIGWLGYGRS